MQAEKRYKSYSLLSHLLLSYYALLMIFLSIFSESISTFMPIPQISIALSVSIFATSLIVYGFKYGETAQLHRECYLRLQRLLNIILEKQYHEIIAGYPNHSKIDFDELVLDRVFWKKEKLNNSKGTISATKRMMARIYIRGLAFWIVFLTLVLFPAYMLFPRVFADIL